MKKILIAFLFALAAVPLVIADGGTLYLYRTKGLPVQKYPIVANRQPVGAIEREQTYVIHTDSDYVLLYLHSSLTGVPTSYMVYRYFVDEGDVYVEIDGYDFRVLESDEERYAVRKNTSIVEVRVP